MKISVIYIIKSKVKPECFYIGSAVNFMNRKKEHSIDLKYNKHCNNKLQGHVNKYGLSDLSFEFLERVHDKTQLIEREQFYIDLMNPFFNICKIAGNALGIKRSEEHKRKNSIKLTGRIFSEETKKKMSLAKKGVKQSEEQKIKRGIYLKGRKQGPHSESHKANLCIARRKRVISDATKLKISISGKLRGPRSEETKNKIRETKRINRLLKLSA
jgi:group I intron endonuclease